MIQSGRDQYPTTVFRMELMQKRVFSGSLCNYAALIVKLQCQENDRREIQFRGRVQSVDWQCTGAVSFQAELCNMNSLCMCASVR